MLIRTQVGSFIALARESQPAIMPRTKDERTHEPMHASAAKLIAVVLSAYGWASASADVYRWVDQDGVTTYTQAPPVSGESVELATPPEPSTNAVDAARERFRREREQTFDELEARKEAEVQEEKQAAKEAKRAEYCSAARENLETFRNLGPRRIRTPDGRFLRLTPDEVKAEIEKTQEQVVTFCKQPAEVQ